VFLRFGAIPLPKIKEIDMKKIGFVLCALTAVCLFALPLPISAEEPPNPTATMKVYDKYISNDMAQRFYNKPVIQSDICVYLPGGFSFDFWYSAGFNSALDGDFDDEADYTLTWDGCISWANLTTELQYWDLHHEVMSLGSEDGFSFRVRVAGPKISVGRFHYISLGLAPYVEQKFVQMLDGSSSGDGSLSFAGLLVSCNDKPDLSLSINSDVAVGYDDGAFGNSSAGILRVKYAWVWNFGGQMSVVFPEIIGSQPFGNNDEREREIMAGGGLSYQF